MTVNIKVFWGLCPQNPHQSPALDPLGGGAYSAPQTPQLRLLHPSHKHLAPPKKNFCITPWTYVINDLNGEEIIGTLYEKELQKTNQQESRIEKVIKRKGDKLYIKWKGYDNSFNSWIDKKDLM